MPLNSRYNELKRLRINGSTTTVNGIIGVVKGLKRLAEDFVMGLDINKLPEGARKMWLEVMSDEARAARKARAVAFVEGKDPQDENQISKDADK